MEGIWPYGWVDELHTAVRMAGDGPRALRQLAVLIAESGTVHRAQVAAEYELYLQAARRADLRAELARWTRALDAFFARYLDDPLARVGVTAAVDGLFIRCFCAEDPPGADEILDVLNRLTHQAP